MIDRCANNAECGVRHETNRRGLLDHLSCALPVLEIHAGRRKLRDWDGLPRLSFVFGHNPRPRVGEGGRQDYFFTARMIFRAMVNDGDCGARRVFNKLLRLGQGTGAKAIRQRPATCCSSGIGKAHSRSAIALSSMLLSIFILAARRFKGTAAAVLETTWQDAPGLTIACGWRKDGTRSATWAAYDLRAAS